MDLAKGKLSGIVQHCTYQISTGKWRPGEKLPSVRKAEQQWGVNRLTVLSAYRELVKIGLAFSEDRKGFFVAEHAEQQEADDQMEQLDELYNQVMKLVKKNTDFDPLAVLKYFANQFENEALEKPKLAFIECSHYQAESHVEEIKSKLNVFVAPVILAPKIDSTIIPSGITTLLATGFHIQEVNAIGKKRKLNVLNIPIEVDPDLFKKIPEGVESAIILELDESMSKGILNDVKSLAEQIHLHEKIVTDINKEVELALISNPNELILLSPRVWSQTRKKWQNNLRVRVIKFQITDSFWPYIAKAAKLPFHFSF